MEVDSTIEENADGSVTVWVNEMERMFHQRGTAGFTLRPGCAYLEIKGVLYNRTDMPQTFLWWANPAVHVNEHYRSVFPPDINAVFDHGKRAVSSFPIATGTYYKVDYSAGVDIANYKNIPVPTSYMGVNSRYDFEGGYECDTQAGMLHVASHHVSPGKKQWTWGNGDFGRAWDRCLTDNDGPYIELMAGVFTENQPDFTWLMPYEKKEFTQYFLPYRELGAVKNATKDLLMNIEPDGDGKIQLRVFATSRQEIDMTLRTRDGRVIFTEHTAVSPEEVFTRVIDADGLSLSYLTFEITRNGRKVLTWESESDEIRSIPDTAEAALLPAQIKTVEQLYLTGLHLEQYRHATYSPVDYYEEGLRRDPDDVRCNNALGLWYLRKGRFDKAEGYLSRAVKILQKRNPNPYDGEPIYNLGLALKYQGRFDEAYDRFYKATWNGAWQDAAFFECAKISCRRGEFEEALHEIDRSLARNWHSSKAHALRAAILMRLGRDTEAREFCRETLGDDLFNYGCMALLGDTSRMASLMHGNPHNYDEIALDFSDAGLTAEAEAVWKTAIEHDAITPMTWYYLGYARMSAGDAAGASEAFAKGAACSPDMVFPNRLEAILALRAALEANPDDARACHYLGNLFYDKRQYDLALEYWERASRLDPAYPTTWRNLGLIYYNKLNDATRAVTAMERAFDLDPTDSRVLMELDQLYKKLQRPHQWRLDFLRKYPELIQQRDNLVLEEATLLNLTGRYSEAIGLIDSRQFHPWEGGEGKVPAQYQTARVELAKEAMSRGRYTDALPLLEECLVYPHNLGEGKLINAQDNDFHYLAGICHRALGNEEKARDCFLKATEGPTEPAAAMYYNDAKPDKIFYAGMAFRALGDEARARSRFNRLVDYGKQHFHDKVVMDYFAVSLPDLQVWDGSLDDMNRIHCLYMLALGYAGLGDSSRSARYTAEGKAMDSNHQGLHALSSFLTEINIH